MKIADEYFNNCRKISATHEKSLMGRKVRYNLFSREPGVVMGSNKAVNFIRDRTYGPIRIMGLKDGERFESMEPVLVCEGNFDELVTLETTNLGFLSYSGCVTAMAEIVEAAQGVPVIDMSARHFPWQIIEEVSLAAYLGGAAGTSTKAGYDYVQKWYNPGDKFGLYASLPHAIAAVVAEMAEEEGLYPSVMAARFFHETFSEKSITVLVDYEGRDMDVAKQAFNLFGDKLFAVRLDTHGGRQMQGTLNSKSVFQESYFTLKTGRGLNQIISEFNGLVGGLRGAHYFMGNGVTIESVFRMRDFLDDIGANNVKIIVSSGFNKEKVMAFRMAGAPMDSIGTGSWIRFMMFTADITHVWENDRWEHRAKAGRNHQDGNGHKVLFERK